MVLFEITFWVELTAFQTGGGADLCLLIAVL